MKYVLASLIAVGLIHGSQVQAEPPSDFLPAQHLEESDGLGGERSGQMRESAEDYVMTHQF